MESLIDDCKGSIGFCSDADDVGSKVKSVVNDQSKVLLVVSGRNRDVVKVVHVSWICPAKV